MDNNSLYLVEFDRGEYHLVIKMITENKTKIKRTLIEDDDIELVIYCDNKLVQLFKSKDIEIKFINF